MLCAGYGKGSSCALTLISLRGCLGFPAHLVVPHFAVCALGAAKLHHFPWAHQQSSCPKMYLLFRTGGVGSCVSVVLPCSPSIWLFWAVPAGESWKVWSYLWQWEQRCRRGIDLLEADPLQPPKQLQWSDLPIYFCFFRLLTSLRQWDVRLGVWAEISEQLSLLERAFHHRIELLCHKLPGETHHQDE